MILAIVEPGSSFQRLSVPIEFRSDIVLRVSEIMRDGATLDAALGLGPLFPERQEAHPAAASIPGQQGFNATHDLRHSLDTRPLQFRQPATTARPSP